MHIVNFDYDLESPEYEPYQNNFAATAAEVIESQKRQKLKPQKTIINPDQNKENKALIQADEFSQTSMSNRSKLA